MKSKWFYVLLVISFAAGAAAHYGRIENTLQFILNAFGVIMVAGFLGRATEHTAHYTGDRIGGFLNATFGNAAELIISLFLVKEGSFDMVKASITGAVIGNLLLVLGLCVLAGGMKFKTQRFNVLLASHNASLKTIAVIALFIPAFFVRDLTPRQVNSASLVISFILIIAYLLWLIFSLITHREELADVAKESSFRPFWSLRLSIVFLITATFMIAFQSEWLVSTIQPLTLQFGLSKMFAGAFLIAVIGNAAEFGAAVMLAVRNKIGASVEIAIGSSLQIALFVAPVLVFASWLFGHTMNIVFSGYEIAAIAVAVFISKSISQDGQTNWYEGVLLLVVYLILGVVFFMLPS